MKISCNEFHISKALRDLCNFDERIFASTGNAVFANFAAAQKFQIKLNQVFEDRGQNGKKVSAGNVNAMGLIDEIFHHVCMLFRKQKAPDAFKNLLEDLERDLGKEEIDRMLLEFTMEFPPVEVYQGKSTAEEYLAKTCWDENVSRERSNREQTLEEMILLHLANENPAFHPFAILFDDEKLKANPVYVKAWIQTKAFFETQPLFGPKGNTLINMLKEPVVASPTSLKGQLDYIRTYWQKILGEWLLRMLEGIDTITEEEKAAWHPTNGGEVSMDAYSFDDNELMKEYERFSPDRDWMPKVILMAKTVLVWLFQLSKKYNRDITRLDQIPDEELDALREQGFTGLWLIGLWERSNASKRIKQINGNPEAASSAYSLMDYDIAWNLGGWPALENLRARLWKRGIRLASDMVPNHTGMDGTWVTEHPDYFITCKEPPSPSYTFNGENLSHDSRVSIYLEDHYYSKSDCAVCYKRVDNATGDVTYIYHGNDGTGMPWCDTAQIDYLNPVAREAVMQKILHVARNFPIIRFDAAMVLAKKHIRRLWYPQPGHGGDIYSRSRYALSSEEFENRIPNEFWREVVDRCAQEMPDTLLLAEAFWMMEGYFTRTLGMHRVYNSAFMNMLKKEENQKYRDTVKNTIKFDPQILKRYVNFMNNPDEETAVAQFGRGDKYFGVCTLMITMPGLPMFGHGQLEGFEEKYGMEYTRAYKDEQVDEGLMNGHRHLIFPLMHKRWLFAPVENFLFYDVWDNGSVNENIFAYSNYVGQEGTVVFYNNRYDRAQGWIKQSCEYAVKTGSGENDKVMMTRSLGEGLNLSYGYNHYVILREHKSGMWYVRKSDDIINSGMFVMLNGFEAQVYTDVREVVDGSEGKYAKLCELLNGRGTEDLESAWLEYRYKELYRAVEAFLKPELLNQLALCLTKKENIPEGTKVPVLKNILAQAETDALHYFKTESEFIIQAEEEARALAAAIAEKDAKGKAKKKTVTQKEARAKTKSKESSPEEKFAVFAKQMEYLAKLVKASEDDAKKTDLEEEIINGLGLEKEEIPVNAMILCTYGAVSQSGGENLLKWGLSRKLTELLKVANLNGKLSNYDMRQIFERIFVTSQFSGMNLGTASFAKSSWDAVRLLTDSPYAVLLSGANEYDGTRWFNKEKMDATLWFALASNAMTTQRILRDQIFKLYKVLSASRDSSQYKCQLFEDAFRIEPKKKAAKATPKAGAKTSAKKEAAAKKEVTAKKETAAKETKTAGTKKTTAKKTKPDASKK
ncbi:MAG: alpha-amylase family glycosyl hydrolase [Treponema sp.]|nr:alpha-amylase family glycosyl hydrolase [Treponema sp.]